MQDRKSVKSIKGQVAVKKDDIDLIVRAFDVDRKASWSLTTYQVKEFDISQAQAEKALSENEGDLDRTLRALVAS